MYTNDDYDLTAVLHVEPRDIGNYANPDYYWQYDSPEVQQLIGDAKVAPTPEEADELLKQAARQISEDSPVDWLLLGADLTVAHQGVTGYPTERHRLAVRRLGDHRRRLIGQDWGRMTQPRCSDGRLMTLFLLRRLGLLVVAFFVTSVVVFLLLRLLPGDLARVVGGTEAPPERIEAIREELGLDRPLVAQYLDWIGGILHRRLRHVGAERRDGHRASSGRS